MSDSANSAYNTGSADGAPLATEEVAVDHGVVVVTLTGEIDLVNADEVRAALQAQLEARPGGLVLDLALDFLGSAGLAVLVEVQRNAQREEVAFGVVATGSAALRSLELSGLRDSLPLFGGVPEAVKSLRRDD
jgi:anti-anti-sigma factor